MFYVVYPCFFILLSNIFQRLNILERRKSLNFIILQKCFNLFEVNTWNTIFFNVYLITSLLFQHWFDFIFLLLSYLYHYLCFSSLNHPLQPSTKELNMELIFLKESNLNNYSNVWDNFCLSGIFFMFIFEDWTVANKIYLVQEKNYWFKCLK